MIHVFYLHVMYCLIDFYFSFCPALSVISETLHLSHNIAVSFTIRVFINGARFLFSILIERSIGVRARKFHMSYCSSLGIINTFLLYYIPSPRKLFLQGVYMGMGLSVWLVRTTQNP